MFDLKDIKAADRAIIDIQNEIRDLQRAQPGPFGMRGTVPHANNNGTAAIHVEVADKIEELASILAKAEKQKPSVWFISECIRLHVFAMTKYTIDKEQEAFSRAVCGRIKEVGIPTCLSVFRATKAIGFRNRFCPSVDEIVDAIFAEAANLESMVDRFTSL